MIRSLLSLAASVPLLAPAGWGSDLSAQTMPVEPGRAYAGGTALASPLTGVPFRLPTGLQAEWDSNVQGLIATAPEEMLAGVWAWSEGAAEEVAGEVGGLLAALGIRLRPRGDVEMTADGLRADFDAATPEGVGFLSDISTGTTTATDASQSRATIALCGGGHYRYEESSESHVSIMGASASSSSSDQHFGQWWLVANLAGGATLLLEATDGRYFRWSVEEAGDAYLVDGYRYALAGAC